MVMGRNSIAPTVLISRAAVISGEAVMGFMTRAFGATAESPVVVSSMIPVRASARKPTSQNSW